MATGSSPAFEHLDLSLNPDQPQFTRDEYFAWVSKQSHGRYERISGQVVAMAPEPGAHLRVKAAIWLALRNALSQAGLKCQALPDGATVSTEDSDYEPDALINCGEPMADNAIVAPNPIVVVEVLSPSTNGSDTGGKLAGYFSVASIARYLIVHPTKRQVIHHRRTPSGIDTTIRQDGEIVLDPPGVTVTID